MTEKELQLTPNMFNNLMDIAEIGWWEADVQNEIYYYSDFVADVVGMNRKSSPFSLFNDMIREDYRDRVIYELFSIKEGDTHELTFPLLTKFGLIWARTRYRVKEKQGDTNIKVLGTFQVIEDQEQKKTKDATIYRLNNLLHQQSSISESLFSFLQNDDIVDTVNKTLHDLLVQFNADRCFIMKYNWRKNNQNCIYEVASRQEFLFKDELQDISLNDSDHWDKLIMDHHPVIVSCLSEEDKNTPFQQKYLRNIGVKSIMLVPLVTRNNVVWGYAGLELINEYREWSREDFLWFSSLMNVLNVCMQLRKSENRIQETNDYLQNLYEYMPIGYMLIKVIRRNGKLVDYEYQDVNKELERMMNAPASFLIGKRGSELDENIQNELELMEHILSTDGHVEQAYNLAILGRYCRVIRFSPREDTIVALLLDETDTYLAHKELEENEALLRNVYQSLPIGLEIFDKDGILIQANDKDVEILGVQSKENYLGVNIFDHPVLPLEVKERMKKGEKMDFNSSYEFSRVDEDYYKIKSVKKGAMNLTTKIVPVLDKQNQIQNYLFINIDNTETTNAYLRIQEFEEYFSLIADYAKVGYFKWNLIKKEGFAISQWFKNLDKSPSSLMTDSIADIYENLYPEDFEIIKEFYEKALTGEAHTLQRELRVLDKDGVLKWLRCTLMVKEFEPGNNSIEMIGVSFDITELKEMILAKDKAETLDKLKSAFLANMSHEIRTPLNAIVGFSDMLPEVEDPEERKEYIKIIRHNNDLLLKLISDILDLSKIESEMFELTNSTVNVKELCKSIITSQRVHETKDVKLLFDESSPEITTYGDSDRIMQVITNLISNGLKFTISGHVLLGYYKQNNDIIFYVEDTGIGIPDDAKEKIFDRFVKLDSFVQGTGLGLPVSKSIVEQMNGKMGFESKVGVGTRFWFRIPSPTQ